jgi:hypothetical protein
MRRAITLGVVIVLLLVLRLTGCGASAQCVDGTYSWSSHRQGTCSWHGGVARWLR